jgi:hypothetical protein
MQWCPWELRKVAAAALLWLSAGDAGAVAVTAIYNSTLAGGAIQRIIDDSTVGSKDWTNLTAGLFDLTLTGGDFRPDLLPVGSHFLAFCSEPQQGVSPGGTYTWSVESLSQGANNIGGMGASRASYIAELLGGVFPLFGAKALTDREALAIQIAIWEIVRETMPGPYVLADGTSGAGHTRFRNEGVSGAIALGQTWLNTYVNDGVPSPQAPLLVALVNQANQDLVAQVDAPGTLALVMIAALVWAPRRYLGPRPPLRGQGSANPTAPRVGSRHSDHEVS